MQQLEPSSVSDDVIMLPRHVINMARRVMQLMATVDSLELHIIRAGGVWYIVAPGGKLERL